ncbi:hypothetical protein [Cryobacterium cryoconiti]|uniref:Minor tail protein n=1 Tax=Cryobacterium cryoconiti TaxID=1259239 RepID=A0A4Y8JWM0_9MICO|nr:hypothetical protein [Cryobacterium cryoconiti]TFD27529.1 hypothetical protein E3T49_13385 [Cryobacterium cryoconiti]
MASDTELILNKLATIPDVGSKLGVFVRMEGVLAVVNVGDRAVTLPCTGFYPPVEGMSVQLERRNGALIVTGPAAQLAPLGVIKAGGSPKCTVLVSGIEHMLGYRDGYVPAIGDDVEINWATGIIQGKVTSVPVTVMPTENQSAAPVAFGNLLVMAAQSGSFNGRWWTNDVYNGDNNTGAWFYSSRVADALRGATVTKVEIFLNPRQASGNSPQIGTHPSGSMGGNVAVSGQIALEPRSGWVQIPLAWVAALMAGGGIGVTRSGYTIWRGTGSDALSGALRFTGTR